MTGWLVGLVGAAVAGPMGPMPGGTSDTGGMPAPSCEEAWPYALEQLPEASDLYRMFDPGRSFGTAAMVDLVSEAAASVAATHPDADPLLIGDMSRDGGGALPPHRYHHDGRSVDVGLFAVGGRQPVAGFEPLWPEQLDVERTWALIGAMLATGRVEHLLLDQGHIDRLKGWLRETDQMTEEQLARTFPPLSTPRLWAWRGYIRHAPRHRDHMHVRIACE